MLFLLFLNYLWCRNDIFVSESSPDRPVSDSSGLLASLFIMKKLLLFVALLGLGLPLRAQDDKALASAAAKADLKLMSFNIRYYKPGADGDNGWVARRAACVEMIRAESPDVIGFQEPHRPQIDYLKVNLPEYAEVDMGRDAATDIEKKPDGGEHLMVMYRRSHVQSKPLKTRVVCSFSAMAACGVKVDASGVIAYGTSD